PTHSKQRALTATARGRGLAWRGLGSCLGLRLGFARGTEDLGIDAAVRQLDVETLACGDLRSRAQRAAAAVAHQRVPALQHAMIAERGQELGAAVQVPAVGAELGEHALPGAPAEVTHALLAPRDALGDRLRAEAAGDSLQPGATRGNPARQRRVGTPPQAVE